ncbi:MAG: hypothetical protein ABIH78_04745 [Candidatus Peregrinibacteria bacterium]
MSDLKTSFEKEPKSKKIILVAAAAAFISTLLPWFSISFGSFGAASVNGWHSFGLFTALSSLVLVLLWLLPKVGVKFTMPAADDVLNKILSVIMLAGPVIFILQDSFNFSFFGVGIYIALAAGVIATYFSFAGKKGMKAEAKAGSKK